MEVLLENLLAYGREEAVMDKICAFKHKDRFHNINNPRGKFEHFSERDDYDADDDMHPFDSYSLGQD